MSFASELRLARPVQAPRSVPVESLPAPQTSVEPGSGFETAVRVALACTALPLLVAVILAGSSLAG